MKFGPVVATLGSLPGVRRNVTAPPRAETLPRNELKRSGDKPSNRSGDTGLSDAPTPLSDGCTMVWPERDFHTEDMRGCAGR
jgi:hypothetical protein